MDQAAKKPSAQNTAPYRLLEKHPLDAPVMAVDGGDLVALFYAAYESLATHCDLVNRLNVFPVQDGDTGTNMLLTMKSAWGEAARTGGGNAGSVLKAAADGALHGSRGNSGVILSQILRGMSESLGNQASFSVADLARALPHAAEAAYRSVLAPVEGTILTVIREVGRVAASLASSITDLRAFLAQLVNVADETVKRTPEMLPVLKQAGVVDSGGKGLFFFFEGMYRALMGEMSSPGAVTWPGAPPPASHKGHRQPPAVHWGFDVQCLIERPGQPLEAIRQMIAGMGEYPLVEGNEQMVKIHVHVLDPGTPLSYAIQVGFVTDIVVENLDDMAAHFGEQSPDGANNERMMDPPPPAVQPLAEAIGLVAVTPGDGFTALFRELGVGAVIDGGQTMNPSTAELLTGIASLPNRRVLLLPNNGNILLAAQQAAELAVRANSARQVLVVPTKTLPQGIAAVLACNPTVDDLARSAAHMQEHMAQVDTGEVAQAVRSAEFDGVTVEVGDFIGLHDGRLVTSGQTLEAVILALLEQMAADESELITLFYAAHIAADAAENLKEIVRTHYPDQHVELAYGGQANFHYILSTE